MGRNYSEWLGVRESIRVTTVKPSGTVSLLHGVTPGCPLAERARLLCADCKRNGGIANSVRDGDAGYLVEPSVRTRTRPLLLSPSRGSGHPTGARSKPVGEGVARFYLSEDVARQRSIRNIDLPGFREGSDRGGAEGVRRADEIGEFPPDGRGGLPAGPVSESPEMGVGSTEGED